ncbi:MAG: hypothetical protein CMK64_05005 [Pseudoalteromonas sp.]|nr:hypothetical protein [Pseudoalteromonas sp.]|tara:strand:- start:10919 stop:12529 length:1611 start_codon:yes stop_codon:yes gene_type:complete
MFYRLNIDGFNGVLAESTGDFGKVIGAHNDEHVAEQTASKESKNPLKCKQIVISAVTAGKKLDKGKLYPDLAHRAVVESNRRYEVFSCVRVLDAIEAGDSVEKVKGELHHLKDEYGNALTFDAWVERFEGDARAEIEARELARQERAKKKAELNSNIERFSASAQECTYSFPAVKGIQAGREYYIAQVPLKFLTRFLSFTDADLPPELRAQRKINQSHANDISQYVLDNPDDYVLPTITVSVDSQVFFDPVSGDGTANRLGVLRIPIDAVVCAIDGQHRSTAAKVIVEKSKQLKEETISVVFYYDEGLRRAQQMFCDINSNTKSVSGSLNSLYDLRNEFNQFIVKLINETALSTLVDKENTSINKKSLFLYSLTQFKKFVGSLLKVTESNFNKNYKSLKVDNMERFVKLIFDKIFLDGEFKDLIDKKVSATKLREEKIIAYAVWLDSLGVALSDFYNPDDSYIKCDDHLELISALNNILSMELSLESDVWKGRCRVAGRMVKNADSVLLTAAAMRRHVGLDLSDAMVEVEKRHGLA